MNPRSSGCIGAVACFRRFQYDFVCIIVLNSIDTPIHSANYIYASISSLAIMFGCVVIVFYPSISAFGFLDVSSSSLSVTLSSPLLAGFFHRYSLNLSVVPRFLFPGCTIASGGTSPRAFKYLNSHPS
ncbi:hypothetical protein AG1IA_10281 [Rhizoctonia solani AG-1 IA]|uniref:Uncharacterized protein n=1 Tax=Thanatephorus cucumeris (strain AG1-IA) TaxID=983506 RepID=L8WH28_THACA|nr:hypothetical protein AG1IA_10281 [Rhizoctonia solani AG-1 IA]